MGSERTLPLSLLVKLGSIAVHAEEMMSDRGHHFDMEVLRALLADPDVVAWRADMDAESLLPVMR